MSKELSGDAVAASLESAFGDAPPPKPAPTPPVEAADEGEYVPTPDDGSLDEPDANLEIEAAPEEAAPAGPEYVIEVDGEQQVVNDPAVVKELLQKGAHYTKNSEINARNRDAMMAQAHMMQTQQVFQQAVFQDVSQLRAIDAQLEQFNRIDMAAMFETDAFRALQLKEQRDQLREARNAKVQELSYKEQQFTQGQAQAAQQIASSEAAALAAKSPEFRDSTKAPKLQSDIAQSLMNDFGYQQSEIAALGFNAGDHRAVLVARAAMLYMKQQAGLKSGLKQVRTAPPVVKPGTKGADTNKVTFGKAKQTLRELGRRGNSRGQEALALKMLEASFK